MAKNQSTQIDPAQFLNDQLESASPDLLRQMMSAFITTLMGAEVDALCGAGYGVPSAERVNSRNGYRHRDFDRRVIPRDSTSFSIRRVETPSR